MLRKVLVLWVTLLMLLIEIGLSACSPSAQVSSFHAKTPIVTSTLSPVQPLSKFFVKPSFHSIAQTSNVNKANSITLITLATFSAQHAVILRGQCRGTGNFTMSLQPSTSSKPYFTFPISCKTVTPGELNYSRQTFPKNEQDHVILVIYGNVEWQAMVEVPNS